MMKGKNGSSEFQQVDVVTVDKMFKSLLENKSTGSEFLDSKFLKNLSYL